ncbi:MAG TPA: site-2 protease family protein [Thermomicrobiales bacterium]
MDDKPRNLPPAHTSPPDRDANRDETYTYRPFPADDAAPRQDEPVIDVPFTVTPVPEVAATNVPGQSPIPRFVPATAGYPAQTWEWQGGNGNASSTAGPDGWYGAPGDPSARPVAGGNGSGEGGWRQSAVARWLARTWPLLLLGLSKLKWLAVIFKFKAFTTFGSMLVSLWAYALFFGWQFAAGFIVLLFIHEMGHAAVMRMQGIKTTPVVFIPMMGAVIGMREMPKNVFAEAQMALGGPILGSLGALGSLLIWQVTGAPIFLALAYSGLYLNLFNLLPVSPLDGGRAMAAISPWGWLIGLVLLLLLFLRVHSLVLGFILIIGGMEVFNRWQKSDADRAYYEATPRQRLIVSLAYFGLVAFLGLSMYALQTHLHVNRPI